MKPAILNPSAIVVEREREPDTKADNVLLQSIRIGGVQEPVIVVQEGDRYVLIKGSRRLRAAIELGMDKVPVLIDTVPAGVDPAVYRARIRLILDMHRQDLLPSQVADLISLLKATYSLTNTQIARYLGIDPDTVTNRLAVTAYIPEIVQEIDAGKVAMASARALNGMTPDGQRIVWKRHAKDLRAGGPVHKLIRKLYPPAKFPGYYKDPEATAERLGRAKKARSKKVAHRFTPEEKSRLMRSWEVREAELEDARKELAQLEAEIRRDTPAIVRLMSEPKLRALVPKAMVPELERFVEVYG